VRTRIQGEGYVKSPTLR